MDWRDVVRRAKATTAQVDMGMVVRGALGERKDDFTVQWGQVLIDLRKPGAMLRRRPTQAVTL